MHGGGERLGEVGGRLVAEVLLGLLDADPESYRVLEPELGADAPRGGRALRRARPARRPRVSAGGRGDPTLSLPDELDNRRLRRRVLQVSALFVAIALLAWLAPGLDSIRSRLDHARPGLAAAGRCARGRLVCVLRAHVRADLLRAHGAAHECRARPGGARRRLADPGRRARRAGPRRVGAAPRRHAHRAGGDAHRGLLPHQVRGQLRRCGGRRRGHVARASATPSLSPALTILPAVLAVVVMVAVASSARVSRACERRRARGAGRAGAAGAA